MGHDWIVGVLDDLRTYAELNGLDGLAASLAQASVAAEDEGLAGGRRSAPHATSLGGASARARGVRDGQGRRAGADRAGVMPG